VGAGVAVGGSGGVAAGVAVGKSVTLIAGCAVGAGTAPHAASARARGATNANAAREVARCDRRSLSKGISGRRNYRERQPLDKMNRIQ
jgi:hypothetical protein